MLNYVIHVAEDENGQGDEILLGSGQNLDNSSFQNLGNAGARGRD